MINQTLPLFKSIFLLLFVIILVSSCGSSEVVSEWDAVDVNSVLILESKDVPKLSEPIDTLVFFKKADLYLSCVQRASKDDFDILYSYLLNRNDYDTLLNSKSWLRNQKISNRQLNGVEIFEVKNDRNQIQLAFSYLKGIFVLSKSSLLIENAIRVFQNKKQRGFKINNAELFRFSSLKSDHGNLYVNTPNMSDVSPGLATLGTVPLLNDMKSLSVYDVKSSKGLLSLNGFSLGQESSLSLFQKQQPVTFKVAKYIPNYSTALVHFGISDFKPFKEMMDSSFLKTFEIGNEIAFISNGNNVVSFVEFKSGSSQDFSFISTYNETYSNYQIRSVNGDLLKKGFGRIFPNVPFNFCTVKDNYLFLSQSVEEMKSLIDAIENDDTWGKTLDYQRFSEKGLQESNVTLIIKTPDLSSQDTGVLAGYSDLIDSLRLSRISWMSVQMSALDNHFYSNVNFYFKPLNVRAKGIQSAAKSSFIELSGEIVFTSLVKNHTNGLHELLIQDSDFMVYLISLNDGIIWKKPIDGRIQGLHQLDFYKNGKLQFTFAAKEKLYVIDRLGRDVAGFPKSLPSSIKFFGLVDYDKSKNYRFLMSFFSNEVYLYDREGRNLAEWGPKKFEKEIINPPRHIKVGGKDFFIIFLVDGTVHVFNRKGDRVTFFHTIDKEFFSGDYYFDSGMSTSSTYLTYISKDGTVTKQNLKGEIVSTDNLLRGKNSHFILRRAINGDGFYFYRTDTDKIAVFNKEGGLVFEKQNSGSTNIEFQCMETGNGKLVFSFYDIEQKLVQVFDGSGNSLIQSPIESDVTPLFGFGRTKSAPGIFSFPKSSVLFNPLR